MVEPNAPRVLRVLVLAAALVSQLAGCSGDDDDSATNASGAGAGAQSGRDAGVESDAAAHDAAAAVPQTLVGAVEGTDIALGAVIAGPHARVFFCGGERTYAQATYWLQLELDAQGKFTHVEDSFAVEGQLQGTTLAGQLMRGDQPTAVFSAEIVRDGTLAGLYDGSADCGKLGLIVRQGAAIDVVRGQGACVAPGHTPQQVNPILPIELSDDGAISVELITEDGTMAASVSRITTP
jgi:hypothetical protein